MTLTFDNCLMREVITEPTLPPLLINIFESTVLNTYYCNRRTFCQKRIVIFKWFVVIYDWYLLYKIHVIYNIYIYAGNASYSYCFILFYAHLIIFYKGPSIDASYQVSVHLAEGFQRRRLKCEKLTDDGCQVMAKAHIAFGNVS